MDGREADGDLNLRAVLYYVNQVILVLIGKSICFPLTTTQNGKVWLVAYMKGQAAEGLYQYLLIGR